MVFLLLLLPWGTGFLQEFGGFLCFAGTNFAIRTDWCFLLGNNFCNIHEVPDPVIHCIPFCFWPRETYR